MWCNVGNALPECKGKNTMKWTNCFGTIDYVKAYAGDEYGIYEGEWKDGERHGKGTFTSANKKEKYIGEWKFNGRNGKGIQTYSDGSKYEGQWENDKRHGFGTYTASDGLSKYGIWKNDNFQNTLTKKNYKLLIPILLVVAITVLLKLFVKKFYNYLIVPIKKGLLLSNSMKGNASRTDYNIYGLFLILFLAFLMYCLFVISKFFPHLEMFGVYIFWYFVYAVFAFISGMAISLRRLNDLKMPRSRLILLFIPIIGFIFGILLCVLPSVAKKRRKRRK
jgi:uncharacterized membrane protein YhaH (DUF805 family)